jgi:arylsulfatase
MKLSRWLLCRLPLLSLAVLAGCADGRPSVVLITVDTLRTDHMSAYGYERETTPNLEALFGRSAVFTEAITPRPKTTPSLASLLTGRYPHGHGVRTLYQPLAGEIPTLQGILQESGYSTSAFVSNFVLVRELSGLDAGFDIYDDFVTERELNRDVFHRNAEATVAAVLGWLDGREDDRPFFLWVHFIDPHGPYQPPEPFDRQFRSPPGPELAPQVIPDYQRQPGITDLQRYVDLYDGEIRYTDAQIGRLLQGLGGAEFLDDNIVIFSTDHGESLGEHSYFFEHGEYLYDQCSRVALSIAAPGLDAIEIDSQVSNIDLLPTLLSRLALPVPDGVDGRDLAGAIRGEESPSRTTFIEHASKYKAIRTRDWKLILRRDAEGRTLGREVYHLESDPAETRNIASFQPGKVAELEPLLLEWVALDRSLDLSEGVVPQGARDYGPRFRAPNAEELEKLRGLGYVD